MSGSRKRRKEGCWTSLVKLVPAEEMIWSKSFIMERERFDGADVAHVLYCRAADLDWERLLRRVRRHGWRVLFGPPRPVRLHLSRRALAHPAVGDGGPAGATARRGDRRRAGRRLCQGTILLEARGPPGFVARLGVGRRARRDGAGVDRVHILRLRPHHHDPDRECSRLAREPETRPAAWISGHPSTTLARLRMTAIVGAMNPVTIAPLAMALSHAAESVRRSSETFTSAQSHLARTSAGMKPVYVHSAESPLFPIWPKG